jgi:hypothetical protein
MNWKGCGTKNIAAYFKCCRDTHVGSLKKITRNLIGQDIRQHGQNVKWVDVEKECMLRRHDRAVEIKLHSFLISAPDRSRLSDSAAAAFPKRNALLLPWVGTTASLEALGKRQTSSSLRFTIQQSVET